MKVFSQDDRINFVDDQNTFVGFDYWKNCCEVFGWFISESKEISLPCWENDYNVNGETPEELPGFNFDKTFFEENTQATGEDNYYCLFRLVNSLGEEKFLCLYNCHNGYYGHGFELAGEEGKIFNGVL